MKFSPEVINLLKSKSSLPLNAPRDCEELSELIQNEVHKNVSKSTLKRLFGFFSDDRMPMKYTLDAIAQYLDFGSWDAMEDELSRQASDFGLLEGQVETSSLTSGDCVIVTYRPDRCFRLLYLGDERFRLTECQHSHNLLEGDVLTIQRFVKGHPMLVSAVERDGQQLGGYSAARSSGLITIEVIKP